MAEVQVLLDAQADDADLGQAHEQLAELVGHMTVARRAVLEQPGVHCLLDRLDCLPVHQAAHIWNEWKKVWLKAPFTFLMASRAVAHFHLSAADVKQRYHLFHRHECDVAYDST